MMKNAFGYLLISIAVLLILPLVSLAKNGWVSDMLLLTFRQGPGNAYAVEKTLVSNTPLVILDEQNDFYKVKLQSGEAGWVDKKFIIFEPPKAILLDQAKMQINELETQITKLSQEIEIQKEQLNSTQTKYSNSLNPLENSLKQSRSENKQLKQELAGAREKYRTLIEQSKNIKQIVDENKQLTRENNQFAARIKSLEGQGRNMFKTAMIKWFLAGVGVLLLGWLIGQSVSSKRRGRRSLLD